MPDYAAMKVEYPKLKAALTRAVKSADPEKIIATVDAALARFDVIGYPDAWSRWENAKDDALLAQRRSRRGGFAL